MSENVQAGSRFVVDLGEVKLPALVEKRVETEIRGVVLAALADSPTVSALRLDRSVFDHAWGRTLGLWLGPGDLPWDPTGPLTPVDHTLVVGQFMTHPFQVLRALGVTPGQDLPSDKEILQAMLDVEEIDPAVKPRIRMMVDVLTELEPQLGKRSAELRRAQSQVAALLSDRSAGAQVRSLRDAALRPPEPAPDWLREILDWIAHMLEDGHGSIYSPDHSFHRLLASGSGSSSSSSTGSVRRERDTVDTIKDSDAIGATAGGFAGSLFPGLGTAAGAASVGAGASVGAALAALVDWLF